MNEYKFSWIDGLLLTVFPVLYLSLLTLLGFAGCAQKPLSTPNPTGVTGGLSRVTTGVSTAQQQHGQIAQQNTTIRTNLQRADDKQVIIDAWKKWKAGQKP